MEGFGNVLARLKQWNDGLREPGSARGFAHTPRQHHHQQPQPQQQQPPPPARPLKPSQEQYEVARGPRRASHAGVSSAKKLRHSRSLNSDQQLPRVVIPTSKVAGSAAHKASTLPRSPHKAKAPATPPSRRVSLPSDANALTLPGLVFPPAHSPASPVVPFSPRKAQAGRRMSPTRHVSPPPSPPPSPGRGNWSPRRLPPRQPSPRKPRSPSPPSRAQQGGRAARGTTRGLSSERGPSPSPSPLSSSTPKRETGCRLPLSKEEAARLLREEVLAMGNGGERDGGVGPSASARLPASKEEAARLLKHEAMGFQDEDSPGPPRHASGIPVSASHPKPRAKASHRRNLSSGLAAAVLAADYGRHEGSPHAHVAAEGRAAGARGGVGGGSSGGGSGSTGRLPSSKEEAIRLMRLEMEALGEGMSKRRSAPLVRSSSSSSSLQAGDPDASAARPSGKARQGKAPKHRRQSLIPIRPPTRLHELQGRGGEREDGTNGGRGDGTPGRPPSLALPASKAEAIEMMRREMERLRAGSGGWDFLAFSASSAAQPPSRNHSREAGDGDEDEDEESGGGSGGGSGSELDNFSFQPRPVPSARKDPPMPAGSSSNTQLATVPLEQGDSEYSSDESDGGGWGGAGAGGGGGGDRLPSSKEEAQRVMREEMEALRRSVPR